MTDLLTSSDSCVKKTGHGLSTTWFLNGSTSTFSGYSASDGYQITASFVWKDLTAVTLVG